MKQYSDKEIEKLIDFQANQLDKETFYGLIKPKRISNYEQMKKKTDPNFRLKKHVKTIYNKNTNTIDDIYLDNNNREVYLINTTTDNLTRKTKNLSLDDIKKQKLIKNIASGATIGIGGKISLDATAQLIKVNNKLKNLDNIQIAKKLYKESNSRLSFAQWKQNEIDNLNYLKKHLLFKTSIGLATTGVGATSLYFNNKKNKNKNFDYINEDYFGSNIILEKIEKVFFKKAIEVEKNKKNLAFECKKEVEITEKILEETFGFENVTIIFSSNYNIFQAATIDTFLTSKEIDKDSFKIIKTKNGIKYKNPKGKEMIICFFPRLFDGNFSEKEIMAVLLHEIGHNFFLFKENYKYKLLRETYARMSEFFVLFLKGDPNALVSMVTVVPALLLRNTLLKYLPKEMKLVFIKLTLMLQKFYFPNKINDFDMTKFYRFISILFGILKFPINVINQYLLLNPLRLISTIIISFMKFIIGDSISNFYSYGYQNEKFADSFAASYGYGSELIKTFNTEYMNASNQMIGESFPITIKIHKLNMNLINNFLEIFSLDEHPDNKIRYESIIKKYEYELNNNKNLPLSKKKELMKELNECKEIVYNMDNKDKYEKIMHEIDYANMNILRSKDNLMSRNLSNDEIYDIEKTFKKDKLI